MTMRERILYNRFQLPSYELFLSHYGSYYTTLANKMMRALWSSYLHKGTKNNINLCYWADQFAHDQVFNEFLISLANAGWITTLSAGARNWAEASLNQDKLLTYCTIDELISVRRHYKFLQYALSYEESATDPTLVRVNGYIKRTGLRAEGAMTSSNQPFAFDRETMVEYREIIQRNLTKSMDKIKELNANVTTDETSYDAISVEILDYYINNDSYYTRGTSYMDSRGRAISSCLSKVGNPIGFKDFRALLVLPTN